MESIYCILKNFRCTYCIYVAETGLCVQVVHHYLQTSSRTKSLLYSTCLPFLKLVCVYRLCTTTSRQPAGPSLYCTVLVYRAETGLYEQVVNLYLQTASRTMSVLYTVQYLFTLLKLVTVCTGCAPLPVDSQQDQVCTVHCTVYVYLAQTGLCVQVMHHYLPDSQQDHVCTVQFLFTLLKLVCVYRLCTTTSRQPAGPSLHCTVLVYLAETGLRVQVVHHYLQTASRTMQSRLRKRGRMGKWSYIHTIRKQVPYTVTMQNIYYVFLDQGKMTS